MTSADHLLVESTRIEEEPTASGGKSVRIRGELGRAAAAHIVFADEIWKSEPYVLQTLLDLAKGGGVRHEGANVRTPLLAFLAASNELPDSEGNLGAVWSRMTLRVPVRSLDRGGKLQLVSSRLAHGRSASNSNTVSAVTLTLDEVAVLRAGRTHVIVSDEIVESVLGIYQQLLETHTDGTFQWLWDDDRRFGRVFDILQAEALLSGRTVVAKSDLRVLKWLLWDTPEQIAAVEAVLAPLCRTPASEAREMADALLAAGGVVDSFLSGASERITDSLRQCKDAADQLEQLATQATGSEADLVRAVLDEVRGVRQRVANKAAGIE